jgi:hypothetical protein
MEPDKKPVELPVLSSSNSTANVTSQKNQATDQARTQKIKLTLMKFVG